MEFVFRKFARTISVDVNEGIIEFDMHRNAGVVRARVSDIKTIQIGFYILFVIDNKKIFYNEVVNKDLVRFLEMLKPVVWRRRGRLINRYW
jgi:hypothetical protein